MALENISETSYDSITVVVETMNNIYPYSDYLYFPNVRGEEGAPLVNKISDFRVGEEVIIDA